MLDKIKIKQSFAHASQTYDRVAELQRNVGHELLKSFLPKKLAGNVVDLGCGTGFLTQKLLPHYEQLTALDLALPMLQTTREKLGKKIHYVCADAESLPFPTASIDTIFSNVALQWCMPIEKALHELHRVLKNDGELIFSTFGSETLCELKKAWVNIDNFAHVNDFYDTPNLHDALQKTGFTKVEIKNQRYISRYDSVLDLMRELKHIGAHNVNSQRKKNLTTKKALATMLQNYPRNEANEVVATFDVIFIYAKK